MGVGYLSTPNLYDQTGAVEDTGADFSVLSAELGGEVVVVHRAALDGIGGVTIRLARATLDTGPDAPEMTSGFTAQNLVLYGRLASERLAATAGVLLDIGQDPEAATPPNADGQHAVLLGARVAIPSGNTLRLMGGADAYLTFARAAAPSVVVDDGDVYAVYLDGRYPVGRRITLGLRVQYVTITDITRTTGGVEEIFPDSDSYQFALIPSVTVHPPGSPLHVTLQGGARSGAVQEYVDYGVALAGKNVAATRLPLALRARFDF